MFVYTHPLFRFIALLLGAVLAWLWIGAVVQGSLEQLKPELRVVQLPTVVVIGHREANPQAAIATPESADGTTGAQLVDSGRSKSPKS
jgi:xanthine/uracil permease